MTMHEMSPDTSPRRAVPRLDVRRVAHLTDTYLPRRDVVVASLHTLFLVPAAVPQRDAAPAWAVSDFRERHGIASTDNMVLFVGRVNREKASSFSCPRSPACSRLFRPPARLVLVGAVYERRWLNRLLTRHRLLGRVVVTGQLPPCEVAAAYACADIFAFPSRTDTQGLVLQEAALAGCRVWWPIRSCTVRGHFVARRS